MTEMDQHIIIIPDLHGREFWREAVDELPADARVVFLGDYLVFGHTKCSDGQPKVYGNVICLDCQKAFLLSEKGIVGF